MGRHQACRRICTVALLALLAAPAVLAQATTATAAGTATDNLPDLSTETQPTATGTSTESSSATSSATTTSDTSTTSHTATSTRVSGVITDAPDIGVGIPTLVIPYTADAPFMQKSNLPAGTFFIAVGGVLAFLGACVLLWRGLVAWSVNRSVKRAAVASVRGGSEKMSAWAPSGYTHLGKGGIYNDYEAGSTMSLDKLTSAGKQFRGEHHHRPSASAPPPAGLFFSPTAQNQNNRTASPAFDPPSRDRSSYLPAGYYASPSADRPAGGAASTTLGGSLAPYARHSATSNASPPHSPDLPPTSRSTATYYNPSSRDSLRPPHDSGLQPRQSRDGLLSRDGYGPVNPRHTSAVYAQPSTSSLMVDTGAGPSGEHLGGSRAPSAYLEDLFEHHGTGPRERF